jgi:hypothetical protein
LLPFPERSARVEPEFSLNAYAATSPVVAGYAPRLPAEAIASTATNATAALTANRAGTAGEFIFLFRPRTTIDLPVRTVARYSPSGNWTNVQHASQSVGTSGLRCGV